LQRGSNGSLRPEPGYLTEQLRQAWPNLGHGLPRATIVEATPIVDSSDMGPPEWAMMAKEVTSQTAAAQWAAHRRAGQI